MKTISVTIAVDVYDRFEPIPASKLPLAKVGDIDFKPILTGPAVGRAQIFITANYLSGFEYRGDNGKVARFDLSNAMRAALRAIFNVTN